MRCRRRKSKLLYKPTQPSGVKLSSKTRRAAAPQKPDMILARRKMYCKHHGILGFATIGHVRAQNRTPTCLPATDPSIPLQDGITSRSACEGHGSIVGTPIHRHHKIASKSDLSPLRGKTWPRSPSAPDEQLLEEVIQLVVVPSSSGILGVQNRTRYGQVDARWKRGREIRSNTP